MEPRADLHLHTLHSDGTFTPEELVRRAGALGLRAIAVTDHDTAAGIPAALAAAEGRIEVVPGVELTAAFRDREIHILGYFIRWEDPPFRRFLSRMQGYRLERIHAMIDRLREKKVAAVTLEEVRAAAGEGTVGRPHLAQLLVERGVVPSFQQAFDRYIGDHAPCFVKGATLTVPRAVEVIRAAGGVAVLAHPHRLVEDAQIPELAAAGIRGIEARHSEQPGAVARRYERIAQEQGLLVTGGSDCHGFRRSQGPLIGTVTVPYSCVEQLREAARSGQRPGTLDSRRGRAPLGPKGPGPF